MTLNNKNYFLRILSVIILLCLIFYPIGYLEASEFRTNILLANWPLNNDHVFTIAFIHSVMLTPVHETYARRDDKIILKETIFSSYGAGNPENTTYDFELIDNGFRIYNINEEFSEVVYRTGAVIANHTIIIKGKEIPFLNFSEPAMAVKFSVKNKPLMQFISEEVLLWITRKIK